MVDCLYGQGNFCQWTQQQNNLNQWKHCRVWGRSENNAKSKQSQMVISSVRPVIQNHMLVFGVVKPNNDWAELTLWSSAWGQIPPLLCQHSMSQKKNATCCLLVCLPACQSNCRSVCVFVLQTVEQAFRQIQHIVDFSSNVMSSLLGEKFIHSGVRHYGVHRVGCSSVWHF